MATRRIKGVQFNGEECALHDLIGCYAAPKGTRWKVEPTDYVGKSFDVIFSRSAAPISKSEAQAWVDAALKHASGPARKGSP